MPTDDNFINRAIRLSYSQLISHYKMISKILMLPIVALCKLLSPQLLNCCSKLELQQIFSQLKLFYSNFFNAIVQCLCILVATTLINKKIAFIFSISILLAMSSYFQSSVNLEGSIICGRGDTNCIYTSSYDMLVSYGSISVFQKSGYLSYSDITKAYNDVNSRPYNNYNFPVRLYADGGNIVIGYETAYDSSGWSPGGRSANLKSSNGFSNWKSLQCLELTNAYTLTINEKALEDCYNLVDIKFPYNTTRIGANAFLGCTKLERIDIYYAQRIDKYAFAGCTGLNKFYFHDYFSYDKDIFENCTGLTDVYYYNDKTPTAINETATSLFGSLKHQINIYVHTQYDSNSFIEKPISNDDKITYANYPFYFAFHKTDECYICGRGNFSKQYFDKAFESFKSTHPNVPNLWAATMFYDFYINISENGCANWANIKSLDMNTSQYSTFNPGSFMNCVNMIRITMPDKLEKIGPYSFYKCSSLAEVKIPYMTRTIDCNAFEGCVKLREVHFLSKFSYGHYLFQDCRSLTAVYYNYTSSPQLISESFVHRMFDMSGMLVQKIKLYVPTSYTDSYFAEFQINGENKVLDVSGKLILPDPTPTAIPQPQDPDLKPKPTEKPPVPEDDFETIVDQNEFKISGSGMEISGEGSITSSSIAEALDSYMNQGGAKIPDTIKFTGNKGLTIEDGAFSNNDQIKSIVFENTGKTRINDHAFENCENLKSLKLPSNIEYIGQSAFQNVGIEELTIPGNCIIDRWAFMMCGLLKSVNFEGHVTLGDGVFIGCNSIKDVCYKSSDPPQNKYPDDEKHPFMIFVDGSPARYQTFSSLINVYVPLEYKSDKFVEADYLMKVDLSHGTLPKDRPVRPAQPNPGANAVGGNNNIKHNENTNNSVGAIVGAVSGVFVVVIIVIIIVVVVVLRKMKHPIQSDSGFNMMNSDDKSDSNQLDSDDQIEKEVGPNHRIKEEESQQYLTEQTPPSNDEPADSLCENDVIESPIDSEINDFENPKEVEEEIIIVHEAPMIEPEEPMIEPVITITPEEPTIGQEEPMKPIAEPEESKQPKKRKRKMKKIVLPPTQEPIGIEMNEVESPQKEISEETAEVNEEKIVRRVKRRRAHKTNEDQ